MLELEDLSLNISDHARVLLSHIVEDLRQMKCIHATATNSMQEKSCTSSACCVFLQGSRQMPVCFP